MAGGNDAGADVGAVCGEGDGTSVVPRCATGVIAPFVSVVGPVGIAAIFSS